MVYITYYNSPVGRLLLASKNNKLTGLWIENQRYYFNITEEYQEDNNLEIFIKTKSWLDRYFNSEKPEITELDFEFTDSPFRCQVWRLLCTIPYGKIVTYKDIAEKFLNNMSPQAVGSAIGHNPISIIVPCHRVVGKNNIGDYASGVENKIKLLKLEEVDLEKYKL